MGALVPTGARAQGSESVLWTQITNLGVRSIVHSGNVVYIGGNFTLVGPNSGGGAALSNATATPATAAPRVQGTVLAAAPDGAGGWFIGGKFTTVGGFTRSNLARVFADGTVSTWNPGANAQVNALVVTGSTVFVGGAFTSAGGQARNGIAAIDAASGAAKAWDANSNSIVYSLALAGPTLYVGGGFSNIGGQARNCVAALSATTGAASSWNPDADGPVLALAVSGATVYAAGSFTHVGGQARSFVAALNNTTGGALLTWTGDADRPVVTLAVSGVTVYAGGSFGTIGGQSRSGIAALSATTGTVSAWNPNAHDSNSGFPDVMALTVSGSTIYVCGGFFTIGGQSRNKIAAIDASSGTATSWYPKVIDRGGSSQVRTVAVAGSVVYVGGEFMSVGGQARGRIAALDATTGVPTSWDPDAEDCCGSAEVDALAVNGSTVYAGGTFTSIGGQPRTYIAALDATTGSATNWNANSNSPVGSLVLSGSTLYVAGGFTSIGGQPRDRLAALDVSTGAANGWAPGTSFNPFDQVPDQIFSLAKGGASIYVSGGFTGIGGQPRSGLAALDTTTGAATAWNPGGQNFAVSELVPNGATVYAGGSFTNIGGFARNGLAALLTSSGSATFWNPNPMFNSQTPNILGLAVSGSTVYVGGGFDTIGGQARIGIAAVNAANGAATAWNPNALGIRDLYPLAADGNAIYGAGVIGIDGPFLLGGVVALSDPGTLSAPPATSVANLSMTSAPNPARAQATIRFTLPAAGPVQLSVFDPAGRRVAELLDDQAMPAGVHDVSFATGGLQPGLYFARLESGTRRAIRRLLVVQ